MSDTDALPPDAAVTQNNLLDGRVRLIQPASGYRAGMDAALLAAASRPLSTERLLELGCGAGAVLTQVAARRPGAALVGLEREADALALADRNIALNHLAGRVEARPGDVGAGRRALGPDRFDWVVSNPPFFDDPSALRAPGPGKRAAWLADDGLAAWIGLMLAATRDGGRMLMIHRADRLADILELIGARAGSFAVLPIQPFDDAPAKRVLVQAIRGGRAPLRLLPALVLHERGRDGHAGAAEAILRGEAHLDLSASGPAVRPGL